jgi:hypothetical protein
MNSGDKFRARAMECIDAADSVTDPKRKLVLLELAQRWLDLAGRVEAQRWDLRGDIFLDDPKPPSH